MFLITNLTPVKDFNINIPPPIITPNILGESKTNSNKSSDESIYNTDILNIDELKLNIPPPIITPNILTFSKTNNNNNNQQNPDKNIFYNYTNPKKQRLNTNLNDPKHD